MASEESICSACGEPLAGRDRYEGKCPACREREVLGEQSPGSGVRCPACGGENPVGLEHCLACEARLRRRRVAPVVWAVAAVGGIALVAAGIAAMGGKPREAPSRREPAAAAPSSPEAPATPAPASSTPAAPPARPPMRAALLPRVREETGELLRLLRERNYDRVVDNYLQPDEQAFGRVQALLEGILHGEARAGFVSWTARLARLDAAAARDRLREAGAPHADYAAALLAHLAASPEASGSQGTPEERARRLLAWDVAGLFEGLDLARAEIRNVEDPGAGAFTAELDCGGRAGESRPGDDPRRVRWVQRPEGWVLRLAVPGRLQAVHAFLKRSPAP